MFLSRILILPRITIPLHGQKNLQAFNTGEIPKRHIKYSFKINGKQLCLQKINMLNSKISRPL